jgi:hypothetical protein
MFMPISVPPSLQIQRQTCKPNHPHQEDQPAATATIVQLARKVQENGQGNLLCPSFKNELL